MISFVRSADLALGKAMEAMTFASDIAKVVEKLAGVDVTVMTPIGGNPNQVVWHVAYENLGALEAAQATLMANEEYMAMLAGAADLFLPGSIWDRILKSVG